MAAADLFDEQTLRKLDRLALVATQVRAGQLKGERRSTKKGTSIEFADYRNYVHGDDLRRLDWNLYARLERPFIKLLEEEEDLAVHVLLDASLSMDWPDTSIGLSSEQAAAAHKFDYARRLSGALGYMALAIGDQLTVATLPDGRPQPRQFGPVRGRGHTLRLLQFLAGLPTEGATDLNKSLRNYALAARRPGLCILVSDVFSSSGYEDGLAALQSRGYEIALLHLLSPDEIEPPLAGDLRLLDVETGAPQDMTLDRGLMRLYEARVRRWRDEIAAYCTRRGVHYVPVTTATPWDELVLRTLRRRGLVK